MHEKRSTRFLVLTRAGGNHLLGQGDNYPHIPKNIGASTGISNQPSTNTTNSEFTMKKKQKNKNHDYQKQEQQTNKMLDAMY